MPNTYVIASCVRLGSSVTVSGTVNGVAVQVVIDSATFNSFPSVLSQLAFIEPLMLAQAQAVSPTAIPGIPGTYVA